MAEATFYRCDKCGELVMVVEKGHCVPQCCGQEMRELVAGTTDAAVEKHVPAVTVDGDTVVVQVGEVAHPMLEEHLIQWVALASEAGVELRYLKAGEEPKATFTGVRTAGAVVYEYCNLHGLWKTEL